MEAENHEAVLKDMAEELERRRQECADSRIGLEKLQQELADMAAKVAQGRHNSQAFDTLRPILKP